MTVRSELQQRGQLLSLIQPDLRFNKPGRPTKLEVPEETDRRAKGFLERLNDICPQEACLRDVIAGSNCTNAGGKGVRKKCTVIVAFPLSC